MLPALKQVLFLYAVINTIITNVLPSILTIPRDYRSTH